MESSLLIKCLVPGAQSRKSVFCEYWIICQNILTGFLQTRGFLTKNLTAILKSNFVFPTNIFHPRAALEVVETGRSREPTILQDLEGIAPLPSTQADGELSENLENIDLLAQIKGFLGHLSYVFLLLYLEFFYFCHWPNLMAGAKNL